MAVMNDSQKNIDIASEHAKRISSYEEIKRVYTGSAKLNPFIPSNVPSMLEDGSTKRTTVIRIVNASYRGRTIASRIGLTLPRKRADTTRRRHLVHAIFIPAIK